MSINLPKVVLGYDETTGEWEVGEEWFGEIDGVSFRVEKGYRFDLASIPRPLWWLIAPIELGGAAPPLVHDFLYRTHGHPESGTVEPLRIFKRSEVDEMFFKGMKNKGVGGFKRMAAFLAVRLMGWIPWPPVASDVRDVAFRVFNTAWQVGLALLITSNPWAIIAIASLFSLAKTLAKPTFMQFLRLLTYREGGKPNAEKAKEIC